MGKCFSFLCVLLKTSGKQSENGVQQFFILRKERVIKKDLQIIHARFCVLLRNHSLIVMHLFSTVYMQKIFDMSISLVQVSISSFIIYWFFFNVVEFKSKLFNVMVLHTSFSAEHFIFIYAAEVKTGLVWGEFSLCMFMWKCCSTQS